MLSHVPLNHTTSSQTVPVVHGSCPDGTTVPQGYQEFRSEWLIKLLTTGTNSFLESAQECKKEGAWPARFYSKSDWDDMLLKLDGNNLSTLPA